MFPSDAPNEEAIDMLLKQLELGLPRNAIGLLSITIALSRGEYLALLNAGIESLDHVLANVETANKLLGPAREKELQNLVVR
jgi:helicase